jgi:hypothetical protein
MFNCVFNRFLLAYCEKRPFEFYKNITVVPEREAV